MNKVYIAFRIFTGLFCIVIGLASILSSFWFYRKALKKDKSTSESLVSVSLLIQGIAAGFGFIFLGVFYGFIRTFSH